MKSGIYRIINLMNNKCYIGSGVNLKRRKHEHFYHLRYNKHCNTILQNSVNKYGLNNFKFEILATCPKEYLLKLEQWFIDNLKPTFNIRKNAENNLGVKRTVVHRENSKKYWNSIKEKEEFKANVKNTISEIKEVKRLLTLNYPASEIIKLVNISETAVYKIKRKETWKEVPDYVIKDSDILYKRNFIRNKKYEDSYYIGWIKNFKNSNLNPTEFCKINNLSSFTRKVLTGNKLPHLLKTIENEL